MRRKILCDTQALHSEPFQVLREQAYPRFGHRRRELYPDTFPKKVSSKADIVLDTLPKLLETYPEIPLDTSF